MGICLAAALALAVVLAAAPRRGREAGSHTSLPRNAGFEALVAAAEDPDWAIRWDAVNELGSSKDRRAVPALVRRALHDDNAHPRWRSLWALKTVDPNGSATVPALRAALGQPKEVVARNAAVALAFFGRAEARTELLSALDDRDSFRRWEAVYSLGSIGDREVSDELIRLLGGQTEPDAEVRGQAVLTLARVSGRRAIPALLHTLRADRSPDVRWRAAVALKEIGDGSITGDLTAVLRDEADSRVRGVVREALRRAGGSVPPTGEGDPHAADS